MDAPSEQEPAARVLREPGAWLLEPQWPLDPASAADAKRLARAMGLVLLLVYGLLQPGSWVPASDSDIYVAVARQLARGEPFTWNGMPIAIFPPGWPWLLASLAQLTGGSYALLNLIPLSALIASALLWQRILLRFTQPRAASLIVGAVFVAQPLYRLSTLLFTDPLYLLLSTAATLLALQVSEGREPRWRIPVALGFCVLMVGIRWAALLSVFPVAGAFLQGGAGLRKRRVWFAAAATALILVGGVFSARAALYEHNEELIAALLAADPNLSLASTYMGHHLVSAGRWQEYVAHAGQAGRWIADFLWPPFQLGAAVRPVGWAANGIGWFLVLGFVLRLCSLSRARRVLPAFVLLYCGVIMSRWGRPLPRYLLAVFPLALLISVQGLEEAARRLASRPRLQRACRSLIPLGLGLSLAVNGALWSASVLVHRSEDFYNSYRAGQVRELIALTRYLREQGVKHGEVVTNSHFEKFGKLRPNDYGVRVTHLLVARRVVVAPEAFVDPEAPAPLQDWLRAQRLRPTWLVYRRPVDPWRVWHYRAGGLQRLLGKEPAEARPYFELYRIGPEGSLSLVEVALRPDDSASVVAFPELAAASREE